ncbi:unnamed protein product, partial [Amoebophrya sp. A25]|eukprot:GSA25T00018735001.1
MMKLQKVEEDEDLGRVPSPLSPGDPELTPKLLPTARAFVPVNGQQFRSIYQTVPGSQGSSDSVEDLVGFTLDDKVERAEFSPPAARGAEQMTAASSTTRFARPYKMEHQEVHQQVEATASFAGLQQPNSLLASYLAPHRAVAWSIKRPSPRDGASS